MIQSKEETCPLCCEKQSFRETGIDFQMTTQHLLALEQMGLSFEPVQLYPWHLARRHRPMQMASPLPAFGRACMII